MDFLKVDTLEVAINKINNATKNWLYKHETVPLNQACGRALAKNIYAPQNLPSFRRSSVDGYAVLSKDVAGASESSPGFLQITGTVAIGHGTNLQVQSGQCAEVPTGGMVPEGADAVVMVEYTENFSENGIAVYQPVAAYENIIEIGDDMQKGELLFHAGRELLPKDIGALAAAGIINVPVYSRPKITIISTGDELVPPEEDTPLGKIRDISGYSLTGMAEKNGLEVLNSVILPDDLDLLEETLRKGMQASDVVAVSGGSSYGKYDITAKAVNNAASPGVFTHGLALKPGKPTILAVDEASRTLIMGLPGHPVSAMVVFELLLGGIRRTHISCPTKLPIPAQLTCNAPADGGKMTVYPCKLKWDDGAYFAEPVFGKSAAITTLTKADGYFIIDAGIEGLQEGTNVFVYLL
ncbi:MAG: molybdopterin molybdotransferase MoeA [Firmicutes bacterium]|nr:molybdopterin molybdotransferase MoeA [Bacillota bacterium]